MISDFFSQQLELVGVFDDGRVSVPIGYVDSPCGGGGRGEQLFQIRQTHWSEDRLSRFEVHARQDAA